MKIVFQNPQLTGDSMRSASLFPGMHDYAVEFLRRYRPAVRIWPLKRLFRWAQFCRRKGLSLSGWDYVFGESALHRYDLLLSMCGNHTLPVDPIPRSFRGMKVHHVMDYSFRSREAAQSLKQSGVDFLLGYASHDRWCGFFNSAFPDYRGRIIAVPFGASERFRNVTGWSERLPRCAVMGAVNQVRDPLSDPADIAAYTEFFSGQEWAHPLREAVRAHLPDVADVVTSFLPGREQTRNAAYDSPGELNRHQLFLNDDSIMHYPPARTFEGTMCGAVMVCSDHPVYEEFGWQGGVNCVTHRFGDFASFAATTRRALSDAAGLAEMRPHSLVNASRFSHAKVAEGLQAQLTLLHSGQIEAARNYWTAARR